MGTYYTYITFHLIWDFWQICDQRSVFLQVVFFAAHLQLLFSSSGKTEKELAMRLERAAEKHPQSQQAYIEATLLNASLPSYVASTTSQPLRLFSEFILL